MRRPVLLLALVAALVAAVLVARSGDGREYRVAAIFDTAKGMVAGQQVKIAGAVVGRVERVELAPGPKARIVMDVDSRFAPFRAGATCRILPEGLISENFVECDPGATSRPALAGSDGGLPTVPVSRTTVPTALQDVIDVLSMPVSQRLRVVVDELGLATAGRGEDLNALLRRTNPALTQARRVLSIVDGQRRQIAEAVRQTDRVMAQLADRDDDVRGFVRRTAAVAQATAPRRAALGESVRRLPALLTAGRAGLRSLDRAMAQGTPLLRDLRAGAPQVDRFTRVLPEFTRAGRPALHALAAAAPTARRAVRSARPAVRHLRSASAQARPFGANFEALLTSTRDQGGLEGLLRVAYSLATSFAAYDGLSHMVGLVISALPQCVADAAAPGCSAKYDAPGNGTIPPNDPSCGPVSGAPWDPATDCQARPLRRHRTVTRPRKPRPRRPVAPVTRPVTKPAPQPQRPDTAPARPQLPGLPGVEQLRRLPGEILLDFLLAP